MKRAGIKFATVIALVAMCGALNLGAAQQTAPADPEAELQTGIALTRSAHFTEAIPHFVAARGRVKNAYAAEFNLALCYVATRQATQAIPIVTALRANHDNADVENLLAQAYVGTNQPQQALAALKRAAEFTPTNEKLYVFVADACMDNQQYELGVDVANLGLKQLPDSARLHFQRAMFLSQLDEFDEARADFALARKLAPSTSMAYVSAAQEQLLAGKIPEAIAAARDGVKKDFDDYLLLTILGEALLRSGISPGQAEFAEAQRALKKAVAARPSYASAQLSLGRLYVVGNRLDDALAHLQAAQRLDPRNPAIYSNLATAYRRRGDLQQAQQMLNTLAKLNEEQKEQISSAPGDRKPVAGAAVRRQK